MHHQNLEALLLARNSDEKNVTGVDRVANLTLEIERDNCCEGVSSSPQFDKLLHRVF